MRTEGRIRGKKQRKRNISYSKYKWLREFLFPEKSLFYEQRNAVRKKELLHQSLMQQF